MWSFGKPRLPRVTRSLVLCAAKLASALVAQCPGGYVLAEEWWVGVAGGLVVGNVGLGVAWHLLAVAASSNGVAWAALDGPPT